MLKEEEFYQIQLVADKKGRLRQAGTIESAEGRAIRELREKAERELYFFCFFVMGRTYLNLSLHEPVCRWLTKTPPIRKLLLLPRNHAKTSIVGHGLPAHILVQPKENNIYWPDIEGCDMKILLAGEIATRAEENLSVIRSTFDNNERFRGMWPHLCWENPKRQARAWNNSTIVIPRNVDYPDPSIRAAGAEAAITGSRPHVAIKDDICAEKAANSPQVMHNAIQWHENTRALYERQDSSLEYIIGTRWAVRDLYSNIIETDPTVEPLIYSIVEDGKIIYPEAITWEIIEQLKAQHGVMFPLLYMNNVGDPDLIDFPEEELRFFKRYGNIIEFEKDYRDIGMQKKATEAITIPKRGIKVSDAVDSYLSGRSEYFKYNRS